jgi:hypothetical protein
LAGTLFVVDGVAVAFGFATVAAALVPDAVLLPEAVLAAVDVVLAASVEGFAAADAGVFVEGADDPSPVCATDLGMRQSQPTKISTTPRMALMPSIVWLLVVTVLDRSGSIKLDLASIKLDPYYETKPRIGIPDKCRSGRIFADTSWVSRKPRRFKTRRPPLPSAR